MNLARPAAVIFDMDGLLLDSERITRETMIMAMQTMGFTLTEADFAPLIGVPHDGNRLRLGQQFGPSFDYDVMLAEEVRIKDATWGSERPLMPGARAIVETMAELGIPSAVATSSQRVNAEAHLTHMGLRRFFDAVLTRDDVERGKPFPDLYLAAAAALGVPPAACLALEDSHNGVRAAHAAGVPVIMVPDLLPATDEMRSLCLGIAPDLDIVRLWLMAS